MHAKDIMSHPVVTCPTSSTLDQAALRAKLQGEMRTNTYNPDTGELIVSADRASAIGAVAEHYQQLFSDAPELAKFDVSSWFGIFLPKATPRPAVDELNKQIKTLLERDDFKKNVATMGARTDWGTPEQYSAFVEAETKKFAGIIEKEGLEMDVK